MKNYSIRMQGIARFNEFEKYRLQSKKALLSRFHKEYAPLNFLERAIVNESDRDALSYISGHLDLKLNASSIILTTTSCSYLDNVDFNNVRAIIDLEPASRSKKSDKLLKAVNTLLPDAGIYIGLSHVSDTKAICGKFVSNGFDIIDISKINSSLYFTAIKTSELASC